MVSSYNLRSRAKPKRVEDFEYSETSADHQTSGDDEDDEDDDEDDDDTYMGPSLRAHDTSSKPLDVTRGVRTYYKGGARTGSKSAPAIARPGGKRGYAKPRVHMSDDESESEESDSDGQVFWGGLGQG